MIPAHPLAGVASNPHPEYPLLARRRGEQGKVVLRVGVTPDGAASEVAVAASSGHPLLDAAAVRGVRTWRFSPATEGGHPIPGTAEVTIDFHLVDE